MWKKALTPISVIVLLVGVGLILFSTFGGDDSNGDPVTSDVSAITESVPAASVPGDTVAPTDSGAPSGTTVAPAATPSDAPTSTGSTGSSIFFPSFPTIVFPSSTFFIPSFPPTSFVPMLPGLTLSPGVIDALTCNSFQSCAQKLYDAWKAGTAATATNFGTPAALATLSDYTFAYTLFGPWPVSVTQVSPTVFQAKSTALFVKPTIRFNFVAGQTGFKVQSVQIVS